LTKTNNDNGASLEEFHATDANNGIRTEVGMRGIPVSEKYRGMSSGAIDV